MIRIIVKVADATNPVNARSGSVIETYRTFDVEAPALEGLLRQLNPLRPLECQGPPRDAWVVGAEVLG